MQEEQQEPHAADAPPRILSSAEIQQVSVILRPRHQSLEIQ